MSSPRRAHVYIPVRGDRLTKDLTHVEVAVSYNGGGMNYANYKMEPRGLYLSFQPMAREVGMTPGIASVDRYAAFSGRKMLIESVARFNAKRLRELAEKFLGSRALDLAVLFLDDKLTTEDVAT